MNPSVLSVSLGKSIRLKRIFSHPSGRLCSVAVDHLLGYSLKGPPEIMRIVPTLAAVMEGRPDSITMHRGVATSLWPQYAGQAAFILQTSAVRPDDSAREQVASVEDAVRLGADAVAVVAFVNGPTEAAYLRTVSQYVQEGERWQMPIICHVYPRNPDNPTTISYAPEQIAWATRCCLEVGVDVIKVPYCGDKKAHADIVKNTPVPIVAAGGPKCDTLEAALAMMADAVDSGVKGATIGRNVWGFKEVKKAVMAFKSIIHDKTNAKMAMKVAGL